MPIAINGSGTLTGISVGGLPDGIVDADMLASNAVTAGKLASGVGGKLVNYVQTVKTDTFSASVAQGSQSGDAIFIDYAATASTNKLLIFCSLNVGGNFQNRVGCFFVVGGVTQTAFRGDTAGGRKTLYLAGNIFQDYVMANLAGSALISNPSTSSTRYSYKLIHGNNSTSTVYLNRTGDDDDANYMHRAVSTITIMEIAP